MSYHRLLNGARSCTTHAVSNNPSYIAGTIIWSNTMIFLCAECRFSNAGAHFCHGRLAAAICKTPTKPPKMLHVAYSSRGMLLKLSSLPAVVHGHIWNGKYDV